MFSQVNIIDGNHLAYRAYYKFQNLRTIKGKGTAILYGVPYILESLIRKFGPNKVIVVFDGNRSKFRLNLLPSYKERDKKLGFNAEDFYSQRDEVMGILNNLGIENYRVPGYEADDIIAYLSRVYRKNGWEVIIITGDKDFNQLLKPNLSIYNVGKGITLTHENLKKEVGYLPSQCVDYLSLLGDDSDNIPGYPGIGPKRAGQFLEKFSSINQFLKSPEGFGKMDKSKLAELYKLNYQLISLGFFIRKQLNPKDIVKNGEPVLDFKRFTLDCRKNEMGSFLKPQFFNTFKTLQP